MWYSRSYETYRGNQLLEAAAQGDNDAAQEVQVRTIPDVHSSAMKAALARTVKEVKEVTEPPWFWDRESKNFVEKLKRARMKYLRRNPQDKDSPEWYYRHAQGFRFLDLPIELRRQIYDVLMPLYQFGCQTRPEKNFGEWQANLTRCIPYISLVNCQISSEFTEMLNERCKFNGRIIWSDFKLFGWHGKSYDWHESQASCDAISIEGRTYWRSPPPFRLIRGDHDWITGSYDWPIQKSLHPTIAKIRHWNLCIVWSTCPAKMKAIRQLVEMFCSIVQVSASVESIKIDVSDSSYAHLNYERQHAYSIENGIYAQRNEANNEDAGTLPACDDPSAPYHQSHSFCGTCYKPNNPHRNCAPSECFWTPRRSKKSKRREGNDLTDLEYVLRPFEVLRGVKHVKVKVADTLRRNHRTQSYILGLEATMMSDIDEDFRCTQQWLSLMEGARKSLFLR